MKRSPLMAAATLTLLMTSALVASQCFTPLELAWRSSRSNAKIAAGLSAAVATHLARLTRVDKHRAPQ
jgi:hypothetical protein